MTTERQIAANQLNATKSTGPKTDEGKRRSRRNAFRHGLAAETVVSLVEDHAAYEALEAEIKADYQPRTVLEHELVVRLASLFWRARRTITIESGLLQIQIGIVQDTRNSAPAELAADRLGVFCGLAPPLVPVHQIEPEQEASERERSSKRNGKAQAELAQSSVTRSFLRLANLDSGVFERLGRYETRLWRQIAQTIFLIEALKQDARNAPRANRINRFSASLQEHPSQPMVDEIDCSTSTNGFK